jgi:hypothetical protein
MNEKKRIDLIIKQPLSKLDTFTSLDEYIPDEFEITNEQRKQLFTQGYIHLENDEKILNIKIEIISDELFDDESVESFIDKFIKNASNDKELIKFKINGYDYCKSPVTNNGRLTETEAIKYLIDHMSVERIDSIETQYAGEDLCTM